MCQPLGLISLSTRNWPRLEQKQKYRHSPHFPQTFNSNTGLFQHFGFCHPCTNSAHAQTRTVQAGQNDVHLSEPNGHLSITDVHWIAWLSLVNSYSISSILTPARQPIVWAIFTRWYRRHERYQRVYLPRCLMFFLSHLIFFITVDECFSFLTWHADEQFFTKV